jgi:creatinine amidohydrolase
LWRRPLKTLSLLLLSFVTLAAQRPLDAPKTRPSGKPPDTVFLEELTWTEVRDLVAAGTTTVIVGTAGTEQKGPHMVDGEHKFVMEYAADKIARALGRTLVAPVITYVPEGSWERPTGHMSKPGTITLPEDRFVELLVHAGRSLKSGGFTTILFLGESGGNRTGMRTASARLNEAFNGTARAFWIDDYYTKSHADQNAYISKTLGVPGNQIGNHANVLDTSELLFVNPTHVRMKKLAPGGGYENSGVSGDPTIATPAIGKALLQIKIDNALAQANALMAGTAQPAESPAPGGGRGGAGRGGQGRGGAAASAGPPRPTFETAPAGTPSQAPDTVFIDELTWEETRDALKAGTRTAIVPTGGTVKSADHLVLGTHNVLVSHAANLLARRLKNALIAPTIQYVPEGDPDRADPGVISLPSPAFDLLLDAAARSLKAHGFTEILFIGDSGGNQPGMKNVTDTLNAEWKDSGTKVFALTEYYEAGRDNRAGISETSRMLHVKPAGVRKSQNPTKATAEIGRKSVELKVSAAIAQLRALANERR